MVTSITITFSYTYTGPDMRAIKSGNSWDGAGNMFTGSATMLPRSTVFTPPYSYSPGDVSTDVLAQALRDRLSV